MEKEVREFYIQKINEGLEKCEQKHRDFFKRLYPNGVEKIDDEKLDHCLFLVNNTISRLIK